MPRPALERFSIRISKWELRDKQMGMKGNGGLEGYFVQRAKYMAAGRRWRILDIRRFEVIRNPMDDDLTLTAEIEYEDADRIEGVDEMLKDQAYRWAGVRTYAIATMASDTGPVYVTAAPTRRKPRRPAEPANKEQPRTVQLDLDEAPAPDIAAAAPVAGRQLDLD